MKVAHLSDLHLAIAGVPARRLVNKRITGWLNMRYKRGAIHRGSYVHAIAREIARLAVDHVVVTGDFTNLALEGEFELARDVIRGELGLDPAQVTVVPGNHDVYTRGSVATRRFEAYFFDWLTSDLPELATEAHGARFPVVKLRGPVAVIGLSSAVSRPPLVAAGELGRAQIEALARVLVHPEVARRLVVLAMHHPIAQGWSRAKTYLEGLRDAPELLATLRALPRGMLLHGHLHRRVHRSIPTDTGRLEQVGATSASLHHDGPDRMAGFNLYEVAEAGVRRIHASVYVPETESFRAESVPRYL